MNDTKSRKLLSMIFTDDTEEIAKCKGAQQKRKINKLVCNRNLTSLNADEKQQFVRLIFSD